MPCAPWETSRQMHTPPAPLFVDPIYNGAADPVPIWNPQEKCWWLLYTNRRATVETPGVAWVHGTDIGIASTRDRGITWKYRGTCNFEPIEPGRNTFWAPEVLWHDGVCHMYVSYITGIPTDWNDTRHIVHYTSTNLWDWKLESRLALSSDRVIDACVFRLPSGTWRMWYKDETHDSHTYAADSADLHTWTPIGSVITDCAHEGPNVFAWRGQHWMITDPWDGLGVYRSADLQTWKRQDNILRDPGTRPDDNFRAAHADVLVQGDEAYLFYFVHPGGVDLHASRGRTTPCEQRRTSLQVARLTASNGVIACDRNQPFELQLWDEP